MCTSKMNTRISADEEKERIEHSFEEWEMSMRGNDLNRQAELQTPEKMD